MYATLFCAALLAAAPPADKPKQPADKQSKSVKPPVKQSLRPSAHGKKHADDFPPTPPGYEKEVEALLSGVYATQWKALEQIGKMGSKGRPMVPWLVYFATREDKLNNGAQREIQALGNNAEEAVEPLMKAFWELGKLNKQDIADMQSEHALEVRLNGEGANVMGLPYSTWGPWDKNWEIRQQMLGTMCMLGSDKPLPLVMKVIAATERHVGELNSHHAENFYGIAIACLGRFQRDDKNIAQAIDRCERHGKKIGPTTLSGKCLIDRATRARDQIELAKRQREAANQAGEK